MKRILVCVLLISTIALSAVNRASYDAEISLESLAASARISTELLAQHLNRSDLDFSKSAHALQISKEQFVAALDSYIFDENLTLQELADKAEIPVKKLTQYLGRKDLVFAQTAAQQQVTQVHFSAAMDAYEENLTSFYTGVVVVGIAIVFASLIVVGFVINQLRHLDDKKKKKPVAKKKTVTTSVGSVTGPAEHINSNAIVAVVTAISLHEMEVEQQNSMLLTFKRAPLSLWRASNIMPNNEFFQAKRGK
jgi:Na+-transporting methylmalonyl-CoA/oxaloacetate decarboxylase gamma subunit